MGHPFSTRTSSSSVGEWGRAPEKALTISGVSRVAARRRNERDNLILGQRTGNSEILARPHQLIHNHDGQYDDQRGLTAAAGSVGGAATLLLWLLP